MGLIVATIVLGVAIGIATFFIVRNLVAPKKIARVAQLLKQNKLQSTIKLAKQMLTKDQRNHQLHYLLGKAYLKSNKPELALMELRMVNQIGIFDKIVPQLAFRREIAQLFVRFQQPDEALKEYLLLIKEDPGRAEYYYEAGLLFEDRNAGGKALGYYRKAIDLEPSHGPAHRAIGTLLYRAKKYPDARAFLEKALRFEPENYEAHYFLGRILKEAKDYQEALQRFEWATKSPEYKAKALIERGTVYLATNDVDRALIELERALKFIEDPASAEALMARYYLASCYERQRNIEGAIHHWEEIYKVRPNFHDVAEKLSQYQELHQDDFVKDFMTASQPEFLKMCEKITIALGYSVQQVSDRKDGIDVVAVEPKTNWRNTRAMPRLIRFIRLAQAVDEATVREVLEEMRNQNLTRSIIVASSSFSRLASDFAESRPIELYGKDQLTQLLSSKA